MSIEQKQEYIRPQFSPIVDASIFDSAPEAKFWVGMVANEQEIVLPGVYQAARIFRANSYIDERNFLPESARQNDGGEMDADDLRSTHLVAVKNEGGHAKVTGNIRSILKRDEEELLPIEKHFPEAFKAGSAPVGSGEASRFIATDEDKLVQGAISAGLIRAILMHALNQSREPVYAIIEAPLERRFNILGLPFERIAQPKVLEDYGDTLNMGIKFEPRELLRVAEEDVDEALLITQFIKTARHNDGLGYYDQFLLKPHQLETKEI